MPETGDRFEFNTTRDIVHSVANTQQMLCDPGTVAGDPDKDKSQERTAWNLLTEPQVRFFYNNEADGSETFFRN